MSKKLHIFFNENLTKTWLVSKFNIYFSVAQNILKKLFVKNHYFLGLSTDYFRAKLLEQPFIIEFVEN